MSVAAISAFAIAVAPNASAQSTGSEIIEEDI